jgi:hypothetical protein
MLSVIDILIVGASAALSARLYFSGLHRRYRAFFLFLIFFTLQNVPLAILSTASNAYQKIWVLTEPIGWFFYAWVVLELYSLVLKDYKGLYTAGRWLLMAAIFVALFASAFTLVVPNHFTKQSSLMAYYYSAERAVYCSLFVFLLTILALLLRYPIVLNRNSILHSVVFSIYFFSNTVIYLVLSTMGFGELRLVSYAIQAVNLGSIAFWLALLNPAGEQRPQRLRPAWMPGHEEKLVSQLNSINVALLRATR